MKGERVADVPDATQPHDRLGPGQYRQIGYNGKLDWEACTPNGLLGRLTQHQVVVEEDGSISVSPSILVRWDHKTTPMAWHGYLERGHWREVE